MDKKIILRNFKEKCIEKYGKAAEDVINQKVLKLLHSTSVNEEALNRVDEDIQETLKKNRFLDKKKSKGSKSSERNGSMIKNNTNIKGIHSIKKQFIQNGSNIVKPNKLSTTLKKNEFKLPTVGSEKKVCVVYVVKIKLI